MKKTQTNLGDGNGGRKYHIFPLTMELRFLHIEVHGKQSRGIERVVGEVNMSKVQVCVYVCVCAPYVFTRMYKHVCSHTNLNNSLDNALMSLNLIFINSQ